MIAIIKYNAGNAKSVKNAVTRLGYSCEITDDKEKIRQANKVIFPGVGRASTAMLYLKERELDSLFLSLKQPVLGICLGLQLMCKFSEEDDTRCLGIFDTAVKKFPPLEKVPHIGWNNFTHVKDGLFRGVNTLDNVYFVHSYYAELCDDTSAVCEYILPFSASIQKNNFYAMQFHPEKSGRVGEAILKNFLML